MSRWSEIITTLIVDKPLRADYPYLMHISFTTYRQKFVLNEGGGAGPFSVTCDWPFLKSVICEKAKFNSVICDRGIICDE